MTNETLFWVTGLAGAGKTSVGQLLAKKLREFKGPTIVLDGDKLREIIGKTDCFDLTSRKNLSFQYAKICKMLVEQNVNVVCCTISMFDQVRSWNRENIDDYVEVFLDVPLDILITRDQKGLYSSAALGHEHNVVGFNDDVELPKKPDIKIVNDGIRSIGEIVQIILESQKL